jgi:CRAL/TRIO domain
MPPHVDKYAVFVHLSNFSVFNMPNMQTTRETISMLCDCFPERLGHCVVYQPPAVFSVFFNSMKQFMDPKTVSKILFVRGDVSDGSANDIHLKSILGDEWKLLTGAEQPIYAPKSSPGYRHEEVWPSIVSRVKLLEEVETTN